MVSNFLISYILHFNGPFCRANKSLLLLQNVVVGHIHYSCATGSEAHNKDKIKLALSV